MTSQLTIDTPDGHALHAVHETRGSDRAVLMCHGISADKEQKGAYTAFAQVLADHALDSLRFDFRGHGQSSIRPVDTTIAGMIVDLDTALDYLARRYAVVHLLASSFGASIALLLSQENVLDRAAHVCLWNPVTDYASTFTASEMPWGRSFFPQGGPQEATRACPIAIPDRPFEFGPRMVAELYTLAPGASTLGRERRLLLIHGTLDLLVAPGDSIAFVERQDPSLTELVLLATCGHGLEKRLDDVFKRTLDFFNQA